MKIIYLAGLVALVGLGSCGILSTSQDSTEQSIEAENIKEAVLSFAEGSATNGNEYFNGLVAVVVAIDVKFGELDRLDEMDASEKKIYTCIVSTLKKIDEGRAAIELYRNKSWPKRAEFHVLTLEWFSTVENIVKRNIIPLAPAMSKPSKKMSNAESRQYDAYLAALETYYEVDGRWVDFQYEFAAVNDFEIEGTIDEDALINEELRK
jgi:hypothetical protein